MDIIAKARELGHSIQNSDTYQAMNSANEACDKCEGLQSRVDAFNLLRATLNKAIMADQKDQAEITKLDEELRNEYAAIMAVPEMATFNEAKAAFGDMMSFINQIISSSANGENPDSIEKESGGCGGSCSSCSGCH